MLALLALLGKLLSSPLCYIPFLCLGYYFGDQKIYARTLCLLLFTMIYNYYLKSLWKLPLPPPLEGWAFPSGHMHNAIIVWGWLTREYHSKYFLFLSIFILSLIGYSLLYFHYHYFIDILGAVGWGMFTLLLCHVLLNWRPFQHHAFLLGFLLSLLASLCLYLLGDASKLAHWQAIGGLIGFSIGWYALSQKNNAVKLHHWQKIKLLVLVISSTSFMLIGQSYFPLSSNTRLAIGLFFLIGFWIGIFPRFLGLCNRFSLGLTTWIAQRFKPTHLFD